MISFGILAVWYRYKYPEKPGEKSYGLGENIFYLIGTFLIIIGIMTLSGYGNI